MHPQLPPPDPNEHFGATPPRLELQAPAMCFPLGEPSERAEQLANVILEYRPGALFVFDTR